MIKFIAEVLTCFIPNKELRGKAQAKLRTLMFGYKVWTKAKKIGKGLWVCGESAVNKNTILGDYVHFNGLKINGEGNVKIGSYFHSGVECLIVAQNHDYDNGDKIPFGDNFVYKDIEIGDFVWMGSRVMILPGTKIGEGAIIQGGAVVHGEIPPYAIAGGNPAKVFKYRDVEHFKELRDKGSFKHY
jgi:acetyltransferase-like isoleucine patch superfamily enzyme